MYHELKTRAHKKRKKHLGSAPVETTIDSRKVRSGRVRGGACKLKLVAAEFANVVFDGKSTKCKIVDLDENNANKDFTRRKILTKGAIITVDNAGKKVKAVITSRPGQDGIVNAKGV